MIEVSPKKNLLALWIIWHYGEMTNRLFQIWKNFLRFNLEYFSVPLLISTLFCHWRNYREFYPREINLKKYFLIFSSNIISRIVGAIARFIVIIIGSVAEIIIFATGAAVLAIWLVLPFLAIFSIWISLHIL